VKQTDSGWSTTVLRAEPNAYRHEVQAAAMALTSDGKARVVFADTIRVDGHWRWALWLVKER
jgi:hypothetical protein